MDMPTAAGMNMSPQAVADDRAAAMHHDDTDGNSNNSQDPNTRPQDCPWFVIIGHARARSVLLTQNTSTVKECFTTGLKSPPTGNLMQGITRYLRGGSTIDYEFTLIDVHRGVTRLRPHPKGQASGAFLQREASSGKLVWEDLTHDFPQRVSYQKAAGDSLIARIEGKT